LIDQVELELTWGFDNSPATNTLLESILEQSRDTSAWPVDLLELSETEAEQASPTAASADPGIHERVSLVTWDDIGIHPRVSLVTGDILGIYPVESLVTWEDIGIYPRESLVTWDDIGIHPRVSLVTGDILGIYPRESLVTWGDLGIYPVESLVTWDDLGIYPRESLVTEDDLAKPEFDESVDDYEPGSPWAESDQTGGAAALRYEGFVDYHNPDAPVW
jgi:hypothetical protein